MSNPLDRFVTQQAQPSTNPLDRFVSATPGGTDVTSTQPDESQPDLTTAVGRQQADIQNTQQNLIKLRAITPANADQAARIQKQIEQLEASLPHGPLGMVRGSGSGSTLKDLHGGLIAGLGQGLMSGADLLAKGVDAVAGVAGFKPLKGLEDQIAEASQTLNEKFNPEGGGIAGTVGNVAGNIIGGAPGYGAAAEATGLKIASMAPRSLVGRAVVQASKPGASYITRAIANMASGSVINAVAAAGTEGEDPSKAATPEEAATIRNRNWQAKLAQFAIGIAGDAAFAAIPHGRKIGDTGGKEVPVLPTDISPDRAAQLDAAKAQNANRAAAAKARKVTQQQVQAAWVQDNPGELWSELSKADKAAAMEKYKPASDPNLDTSGNPDVSALQEQIANLNQKLSDLEGDKRVSDRLAETDHQLNIGNRRALDNARSRIDNDPNMAWIMVDGNGMKSINDNLGYDTGSQFLQDARDHIVQAAENAHNGQVFRYGGDEFLISVPKKAAEQVHNSIENFAKDYSTPDGTNVQRGTLSGAIFNTLDEALGLDGKAKIAARKIAAKAVHNIPGRDAEEQGLIDAFKAQTRNTGEAPAAEPGAGAPAPLSGDNRPRNTNGDVITPGNEPSLMRGNDYTIQQQIVNTIEDKLGRPLTPEEHTRVLTDVNAVPVHLDDADYQNYMADVVDTHTGLKDAIGAHNLAGSETAPELPDGSELPPEVEEMFKNIHSAGGAQTPEEMDALISEVTTLRSKGLPQDQYMAQLKDLEEDFSPYHEPPPTIDELHTYADRVKRSPAVTDVELIGSKAKNNLQGNDTDILYTLKDEKLPADEVGATQRLQDIIEAEIPGIDLDRHDSFFKVGDRYFHLSSGAGRELVENTSYAADHLNEPKIPLGKGNYDPSRITQEEMDSFRIPKVAPPGISVHDGVNSAGTKTTLIVHRGEDGKIDGHLAIGQGSGGGELMLNVFVEPGSRRTGIATALYKRAEQAGFNVEHASNTEIHSDEGLAFQKGRRAKQLDDNGGLKTTGDGSGAPGTQPRDEPPTGAVEATSRAQGASGASDTPPPVSSVTKLETVKGGKPLEELTEKQLTKLEDHLIGRLQKAQEGSVIYESLQSDLDKVMAVQSRMGDAEAFKASQTGLPEGTVMAQPGPSDFGGTGKPSESQINMMAEAVKPASSTLLANAKNIRSLTNDELSERISLLKTLVDNDLSNPGLRTKLDKALEEQAFRSKGSGGVVARMPPGVGGAALGFAYGYMSDPNDPDRVTNALEWGLVGAVAGTMAGRMLARAELKPAKAVNPNDLPGGAWQAEMRKYVVGSDPHPEKPVPFLERMRNIYGSIVRRSYVMERWQQSVGGNNLTGSKNAAKLFANFGRWMGNSEAAIKYGPVLMDEFGTIKRLNAQSILSIMDLVKGDTQSLGELMAARAKIELGDRVKTPFNQLTAEMTFNSMPENYHQAADASRQFSLAMADVLVDGGVLSQDARDLFANESMYASLQRVFKFDTGQELSAEGTGKAIAKAVNPLKSRKGGSEDLVKNPFEVMVQLIPRFYRAAELNKIKVSMVDAWEAADNPGWLLKRIGKSEVAGSAEHDMQIKQLQEEMKISVNDANALVAGLNPSTVDPLKGTMKVYRNGVLESYRMPKELAVAMQTLQPDELGVLTKMLGIPARLASKGITMNPYFVAKMSLYDMWQATLNSQYGFRFGVDNIRGFIAASRESQTYKDWISAGGAHQTLYNAGRKTISGQIDDVKLSLGTPLEVAIKNMRELKPIEAYKALIGPFADAARVGEYLRAKDHGASDLEAVFASKQVTANYSEIGSAPVMKSLQHMTMFLGPAIQVLDQATYRAGVHPFRTPEEGRLAAAAGYGMKAFMTIALPSWYLWHANKDDKEINQLRQTQTGRKYWFVRSGVDGPGIKKGDIIKIPKPPVDGQIFGTSIENMLDSQNGMDPGQTGAVTSAIVKDAMFNILPSAGVIPYSLQTNQDLSTGRTIIPGGDEDLALQYQGDLNASWVARAVSKAVVPFAQNSQSQMVRNAVTPAGIDYLINSIGGMVGQDLAKGVSQAIEDEQKGYVPAKEEYPIIGKLFAQYPTFNVRSVQNFYNRAAQVQTVGATINHLAAIDQKQVLPYVESNKKDVALIDAYAQGRQTIANARRTIVDIKNAPAGVMDQATRKRFINMQLEQIIQYTTQIEKFTAQVDKQYK